MYSCNFDEVSVQMQDYLNVKFKETGHSNMYFPQVFFLDFIAMEACRST